MKRFAILAGVAALLLVTGLVLAQSSDNYNLDWHVVAGGGQTAGSANYVVHSTIGQALGDSAPSSDNFDLGGGFWGIGGGSYSVIYLPLITRNSY